MAILGWIEGTGKTGLSQLPPARIKQQILSAHRGFIAKGTQQQILWPALRGVRERDSGDGWKSWRSSKALPTLAFWGKSNIVNIGSTALQINESINTQMNHPRENYTCKCLSYSTHYILPCVKCRGVILFSFLLDHHLIESWLTTSIDLGKSVHFPLLE